MAKQKLTFSFVDPNRPEAFAEFFLALLLERLRSDQGSGRT